MKRPTLKTMSQAEFDLLTKEDRWISEIATASTCLDSNRRFKHYKTITYPVEYIVTEEMMAAAKALFEKRRQEILDDIKPGELCFVSMGMDTDEKSSVEDGVNNHRIRCYFMNDIEHKYFVEFIRGMKDDFFYIDGAVDCDREETCRREGRLPGNECYNPHNAARKSFHKPFTWKNVVATVNRLFGCSYVSARKIDYFVRAGEFVNRVRPIV